MNLVKPIILEIDSGNVLSLKNIISKFSENILITKSDVDLENCTHIFLPGVGSYSEVMKKIKNNININLLKKKIIDQKVFFMGICVGMQVLSNFGHENEKSEGLSIINGNVRKLNTKEVLPHVGWNSLNFSNNSKIFNGISDKTDFYFTHSFIFELDDHESEIAFTNYGVKFSSMINKENIFGTQFHPEKSQAAGIKLIKNFLELRK